MISRCSTNKMQAKNLQKEEGAIVIEASLSLSFFMFAIVTVLSIVNLCIAQAKIGIALNQTAKEISQYTYIYSLSGVNEIQGKLVSEVEAEASDVAVLEKGIIESISALQTFAETGTGVDETFSTIGSSATEIEEVVNKIANATDKKAWIISVLKICGNEGYEAIKGVLAGTLAKGLMQKHLTLESGVASDAYLKHLGITDGVSGLNLMNSAIFINGTEEIQLICKYDVSLIKLLNQEYKFSFVQTASTMAWGAQSLAAKNCTETDAVDSKFVLVSAGEGEKFGEYAAKTKPEEGYVDVIIHAAADGTLQMMHNGEWKEMTISELDDALRARGYDGKAIRLISCGTGSSNVTTAQKIANQLEVEVLAPTDTVWAYPNGKLVVGPDAKTNSGTWKSFTPSTPVK